MAKKFIIAFANEDGYFDQGEPGQNKSYQEDLGHIGVRSMGVWS